jgi:hypothetical protein
MVALQGWGTGDTEALIGFVAEDKVPVWSASYSGHLTDPTGKNPDTKKPAPYNFFYGPSYTDACRAMVQTLRTVLIRPSWTSELRFLAGRILGFHACLPPPRSKLALR